MDRDAELELVSRLREGDPAAFDVVHAAFNARLFSFLVRVTRSRERAEDLVEETWLRLVTHADRLRPDTSLWPQASSASPFEETAASQMERRVEVALASLPVAYREVLLLVAVEGLGPSEAASVCGIAPAAFRQRLKRARDLLARRLEDAARPVRATFREVNP